MKRSQTAKTSKKSQMALEESTKTVIEFVDEESRHRFCQLLISNSRKPEIREAIEKKQAKYKSFKINAEIPEFSELGIDPKFTMHFKKVKNSDEWDLDLEFKKKENTNLEEYFSKVE